VRLLAALVLSGCLGPIAPDVGALETSDGGTATCSNLDSDPAMPVSFGNDILRGVFDRGRCIHCHTGGMGTQQSGLDLSSYSALRTGGGRSGPSIVVDAMPCQSVLVQKLETSPPFGQRMPLDGPPYLADADIQLVSDWIAEGADDN